MRMMGWKTVGASDRVGVGDREGRGGVCRVQQGLGWEMSWATGGLVVLGLSSCCTHLPPLKPHSLQLGRDRVKVQGGGAWGGGRRVCSRGQGQWA